MSKQLLLFQPMVDNEVPTLHVTPTKQKAHLDREEEKHMQHLQEDTKREETRSGQRESENKNGIEMCSGTTDKQGFIRKNTSLGTQSLDSIKKKRIKEPESHV